MPLRFLGQKGAKLPELKEEDWKNIFDFLEFFVISENLIQTNNYADINFDWKKVTDILKLLNKVKPI